MWEYGKGIGAALVVNVLTLVGWMYVGMWLPAVVNAMAALLILGIYGLEDKWAFPLGYWTVQLLAIVVWLSAMGMAGRMSP